MLSSVSQSLSVLSSSLAQSVLRCPNSDGVSSGVLMMQSNGLLLATILLLSIKQLEYSDFCSGSLQLSSHSKTFAFMSAILDFIIDVGMTFGPAVGYLHQYRIISQKKNAGTFSIDICGILLFANLLRINFYLFEKYKMALLFQSFVMITTQLFLLQICCRYKKIKAVDISLTDKENQLEYREHAEHFWRWDNFYKYGLAVGVFSIGSFLISYYAREFELQSFGVLLGLMSLLSQSVLITPQIIRNIREGRVNGLSYILVVLNWSGDLLKLIYFLINDQPFQFILCGIIQIVLDTIVILQILYYYKKGKLEKMKQSTVLKEVEQLRNIYVLEESHSVSKELDVSHKMETQQNLYAEQKPLSPLKDASNKEIKASTHQKPSQSKIQQIPCDIE